jgi:hypothetical protein
MLSLGPRSKCARWCMILWSCTIRSSRVSARLQHLMIIRKIFRVLCVLLSRRAYGFCWFSRHTSEMRGEDAHAQMQNDLIEHLWKVKGNAEVTWCRICFISIVWINLIIFSLPNSIPNYLFIICETWFDLIKEQKNILGAPFRAAGGQSQPSKAPTCTDASDSACPTQFLDTT